MPKHAAPVRHGHRNAAANASETSAHRLSLHAAQHSDADEKRRRHAEANPCGCRSCCCSEAHRNATNTSSLNITSLHYIPVPKSGSESTKGTLFSLALNHSCYVRSGPHKMSLSARPISYPWLTGAPLGGDLVIGTLREPEERFLSTFEAFLGKQHSVQKLNKADAAFFASPQIPKNATADELLHHPIAMPFLTSVATCRGSCAGHFLSSTRYLTHGCGNAPTAHLLLRFDRLGDDLTAVLGTLGETVRSVSHVNDPGAQNHSHANRVGMLNASSRALLRRYYRDDFDAYHRRRGSWTANYCEVIPDGPLAGIQRCAPPPQTPACESEKAAPTPRRSAPSSAELVRRGTQSEAELGEAH